MSADRSKLTPRELAVLGHVVSGRSNREIGAFLSITEGTVKGHLHRIYRKLRVANRTQAAVAANGAAKGTAPAAEAAANAGAAPLQPKVDAGR